MVELGETAAKPVTAVQVCVSTFVGVKACGYFIIFYMGSHERKVKN